MKATADAPLYFAYGASLNQAHWADFCQRNGFDVDGLVPEGPAVLPDMELVFERSLDCGDRGVLNIRPAVGHVVHGMLYRINAAGWVALQARAEAPCRYQRRERVALLDDGSSLQVSTLELPTQRRDLFCPPSAAYVQVIRDGLASWGLPTAALEAAARGRMPRAEIDQIFIYGSLLGSKGQPGMIPPAAIRQLRPARTHGRLHDTGLGFPVLSRKQAGKAMVEGECIRFARIEQHLPALDSLEGFYGYSDQGCLFFRTVVEVEADDGSVSRAWCYTKERGSSPWQLIEHGSWRRHQQAMLA